MLAFQEEFCHLRARYKVLWTVVQERASVCYPSLSQPLDPRPGPVIGRHIGEVGSVIAARITSTLSFFAPTYMPDGTVLFNAHSVSQVIFPGS